MKIMSAAPDTLDDRDHMENFFASTEGECARRALQEKNFGALEAAILEAALRESNRRKPWFPSLQRFHGEGLHVVRSLHRQAAERGIQSIRGEIADLLLDMAFPG